MAKVLVIGAGVSGVSASTFLRSQGHSVLICDRNPLSTEISAQCSASGVVILPAGEILAFLDDVDSLVIGPTVTSKNTLVACAQARGQRVLSEIDLALLDYHGSTIGVTGTNGKSTVTAMIAHGLNTLGVSAVACGNIGLPPTAVVAKTEIPDALVIELSSYQLEYTKKLSSDISIFTSFSTDHLARHGTMENYFGAKWRLIKSTKSSGLCIMTSDVANFAGIYNATGLRSQLAIVGSTPDAKDSHFIVKMDRTIVDVAGRREFAVPWIAEWHNCLNACMAALAIGRHSNVSMEKALASLKGFVFLPHRFQTIGTFHGFPVVNDSKSTNVESTLVALRNASEPVILMLGGQGKGESFTPILDLGSSIRKIVIFGASRDEIMRDLGGRIDAIAFNKLGEAIEYVKSDRAPRGPILFSPACASFDEFRNFEHRGEVFSGAFKP